jgi:hypothetical protein
MIVLKMNLSVKIPRILEVEPVKTLPARIADKARRPCIFQPSHKPSTISHFIYGIFEPQVR